MGSSTNCLRLPDSCHSNLRSKSFLPRFHNSIDPLQVPCISSAASLVGCGQFEYACQCSSSAYLAIQSAAQGCVLSACSADAASVLIAANAICSCASSAGGGSSGSTTSSSGAAETSSSAAPSSISSAPIAAATATTANGSPTISGSGGLPQNTSTGLPPFTGGQGMLMPWVGVEFAVVALFGGLLVLL